MRIIYLHQYFTSPNMSGGTRSYELARRMVAKGHEVHVITTWREPIDHSGWFETNCDGIRVHWLPVKYSNNLSFVARLAAFMKYAIFASLKSLSIKADIIFATSTPLTVAIPAVISSKLRRIPMVFEVRDLWPETPIAMGVLKNGFSKWLARKLERWAYKNSNAIIALSPGMRDGIVSCAYPATNVAVIPNSADMDLFTVDESEGIAFRRQREWLDNRPLIVYAGTFGFVNGVAYLVELACYLRVLNPDIRVLLIGGGSELSAVIELAKKLNVYNENVFFENSIPKNKMPALLSAADLSCSLVIDIPELHKNSANKFFDTLAAGRPIMINHGGWMAELIRDHGCGVVTYKLPIEVAARQIAALLDDHQRLVTMRQNAKSLALRQFDRDALAEQVEEVLNFAIGKANKSPYLVSSQFYN